MLSGALRRIVLVYLLAGSIAPGAQEGDFPGFTASDSQIFRSNLMGMTLEKIEPFRKDEYPYVLAVNRRGEREIRRLYQEGSLHTEWIREYSADRLIWEQERRGKEITERRFQRGLLMEESFLLPGEEVERWEYRYGQDGGLREIVVTRGEGLLYRDIYSTDRQGRLLGVRREEASGGVNWNLYGYPSGELYQEWHQSGSLAELFRFRKDELEVREVWRQGVLAERESWTTLEGGRISRLSLPDEEREIIQLFDAEGSLIAREENGPGGTIRGEYIYTDGRLTEKIERYPGERLRFTYGYEGDRLIEERMERNGLLITRILFEEEGRERRETYHRGVLLVTVIYENDLPVETIYHGEEERLEQR